MAGYGISCADSDFPPPEFGGTCHRHGSFAWYVTYHLFSHTVTTLLSMFTVCRFVGPSSAHDVHTRGHWWLKAPQLASAVNIQSHHLHVRIPTSTIPFDIGIHHPHPLLVQYSGSIAASLLRRERSIHHLAHLPVVHDPPGLIHRYIEKPNTHH